MAVLYYSDESNEAQIEQIAGLSLHAGIMARRDQRKKLERLCRYICRPAVSKKRLAMTPGGRIRYDVKGFINVARAGMRRSEQFKTPCRDSTTHVFSNRWASLHGWSYYWWWMENYEEGDFRNFSSKFLFLSFDVFSIALIAQPVSVTDFSRIIDS